jgi:hypothetical protein
MGGCVPSRPKIWAFGHFACHRLQEKPIHLAQWRTGVERVILNALTDKRACGAKFLL